MILSKEAIAADSIATLSKHRDVYSAVEIAILKGKGKGMLCQGHNYKVMVVIKINTQA